jgi:hypothetical protein
MVKEDAVGYECQCCSERKIFVSPQTLFLQELELYTYPQPDPVLSIEMVISHEKESRTHSLGVPDTKLACVDKT